MNKPIGVIAVILLLPLSACGQATCADKLKQLEATRKEASADTARAFFECKAMAIEFGSNDAGFKLCMDMARDIQQANSQTIADVDKRMMDPDIRNCR